MTAPSDHQRSNQAVVPVASCLATPFLFLKVSFLTCFFLVSCSPSGRPPITAKVPLTHVTGKVLVNGVPTQGVQIQYIPQSEIAEKRERYLNRFFLDSSDNGKFSLSTYVNGDGIPYGEYTLEFKLIEQRLSGEIDRLGGSYSYPKSKGMKITVIKGKDLDLGTIQLETPASPAN